MEPMITPNKADQGYRWSNFHVIFVMSFCALESKQTQQSVHFGHAHCWLFVQLNEFLPSKAHFPANVYHEITWTTEKECT